MATSGRARDSRRQLPPRHSRTRARRRSGRFPRTGRHPALRCASGDGGPARRNPDAKLQCPSGSLDQASRSLSVQPGDEFFPPRRGNEAASQTSRAGSLRTWPQGRHETVVWLRRSEPDLHLGQFILDSLQLTRRGRPPGEQVNALPSELPAATATLASTAGARLGTKAVVAVNRTVTPRLEWHARLFAARGAGRAEHLARAITAPRIRSSPRAAAIGTTPGRIGKPFGFVKFLLTSSKSERISAI